MEKLEEFIDEVKRMSALYHASRYTQAEELKNTLSEELDNLMRLDLTLPLG